MATYLSDRRLSLASKSEERRGSTRRDSAEAAEWRVSEPHRGAQRTLTAATEEESRRVVGGRQCRLRGVVVVTGVLRAGRQVAVASSAPECLGMLAVLSANPRATRRLATATDGGGESGGRGLLADSEREEEAVVREVMTRKRWRWCERKVVLVVVVVVVRMDVQQSSSSSLALSRSPSRALSALGACLFFPLALRPAGLLARLSQLTA